jgi:broad specificity phosphatase PhoE
LAGRLAAYDLTAIITSTEPKALETGQIVAGLLSILCETASDLHEHQRYNAGWQVSREQFQAKVASAFENPGKLIFGSETADETHRRFAAAMTHVLERHPAGSLAVVTHGTVMTLFIARRRY